ncbi:MAG: ArsR family transcriptional regulator [Candidatus Thermoplasmatota archaeon]|nr:ArsR family transcriptional regulator [Candidatus Thermoplasmatota archaeon]
MAHKNSTKKNSGYKLTPRDQEAVDIFTDLGLPKNLAKTLLYVSQVEECRSSDIERGAGLRQPEVSIAMQELSDRGWVVKRNQRKEGKGRPIYIYKLISPLPSIMKHIEEKKSQEINSIKKDLRELKSLLEKRNDF